MIEYLIPATVEEAVKMGSQKGAAYIGGGTWLNSCRRDDITSFVSLEALGLDGISNKEGAFIIGAATRFQQIQDDARLPKALREAAGCTASRSLRNMITLGGDVRLNDPGSCMVPAIMVLGGEVITASSGPGDIGVLQAGTGLITEVRFPDDGRLSDLRCISRTSHSRRNLVCAVSLLLKNDRMENVRIVLGDCVDQARRYHVIEENLNGKTPEPAEKIEQMVSECFTPKSDYHASAGYKLYMAGIILADLLIDTYKRGVDT